MFRSSAFRQHRYSHSAVLLVMFTFVALEAAYSLVLPPIPPTFAFAKNFGIETVSRVTLPDGDVVETRSLSASDPITSIEIQGGGITVEVTCQQEQGLQVIGDPDMVRTVETDVDDGQLQISGSSWRSGKRGVVVKVAVQTLEDIQMSGANIIKVVRLNANQLDVEMSGACSLDISGKARKFNVEASGACIVNAKDLIAEKITVEADGASKIIVNAEKQLCASVSGVSKVVYYGEPKTINKDICGMGRIVQQANK